MNQSEYIQILLTGIFEHKEYLSEYFHRERLKAENNHVGSQEFVTRLTNAWHILNDEVNRQELGDLEQLKRAINSNKEYNKLHPDNEECKTALKSGYEQLKVIENGDYKENFKIHLGKIPGGDYELYLYYYEILDIKRAIQQIEQSSCYDSSYSELVTNKYINCHREVFNYVMEYKKLPGDAKAITWLKAKTEAIYFQRGIKFPFAQFKDCFVYKDGKQPHDHDRPPHSPEPKAPLPDITKKLFDKIRAC